MKKPSICLCMIVKDEAENIERCLKSVRRLVSEILVVDTGSVDKTKEICEDLGAVVLSFPWCNDFAAARNFALENTAADWILWVDADETVHTENPSEVLEYLHETENDVVSINMIHYYGTMPVHLTRSYHIVTERLFRNNLGIHFQGSIHEHLVTPQNIRIGEENCVKGVQIEHFGYLEEAVQKKEKHKRNLTLLMQEWQSTQEPWIAYHIASEWYRVRQYDKSYNWINECLRFFLKKGTKPPALAYKLKYEILLLSSPDVNALEGVELALKIYPDYVDLHYYRGLILYHLNQFLEAADCFLHCMTLGENNSHYLSLHGAGSFLAFYYLELCIKNF